MFDDDKWSQVTVTTRTEWADGLFSFEVDAPRDFQAGQFARLALPVDGEEVWRAYSIASPPGQPLEFFIVRVDDGRLTPHLDRLRPGDPLHLHQKIAGTFTLERVEHGGVLWMIGTGTGLAPYLSMLREGSLWERYERVVLVHGVRHPVDLAYRALLEEMALTRPLAYLPATTREPAVGCLSGRLTALLRSGALEEAAGRALVAKEAHVLMCGNPDLIKDLQAEFKERDIHLYSPRNRDGRLHVERYW
jgi:ferredoxin--NADP+ reductase